MLFQQITMLNYSRPIPERAKSRKVVGPYTWQPSEPGKGRGFYQADHGLSCDPRGSTFDLRLSWANDYLASSRLANTTGYYCDEDGGDSLHPIVARLPHSRGFLAGWTMGASMAASLDATIYATPEDAARAAHDIAEHDAEREYQRQQEEREDEDEDDSED